MNKNGIVISPSIIEQLSEDPTKYWAAGIRIVPRSPYITAYRYFSSETAAWISRERWLASYRHQCVIDSPPREVTRERMNEVARIDGVSKIVVEDESGTVVDSWSVE